MLKEVMHVKGLFYHFELKLLICLNIIVELISTKEYGDIIASLDYFCEATRRIEEMKVEMVVKLYVENGT